MEATRLLDSLSRDDPLNLPVRPPSLLRLKGLVPLRGLIPRFMLASTPANRVLLLTRTSSAGASQIPA